MQCSSYSPDQALNRYICTATLTYPHIIFPFESSKSSGKPYKNVYASLWHKCKISYFLDFCHKTPMTYVINSM